MRLIPSFAALSPLLVLLGSCVGPAQRAPAPAPTPAPRPAPAPPPIAPATPAPVATEWHNRPTTPGTWTYRTEPTGSVASFGPGATAPHLAVRCDRATSRIAVVRMGTGQGAMTLRTSYGAVLWPTTSVAAPQSQVQAVRAASDVTLDQIAYSRGKFAVEVQGLAPLILPAWAEVARVIEDCRG